MPDLTDAVIDEGLRLADAANRADCVEHDRLVFCGHALAHYPTALREVRRLREDYRVLEAERDDLERWNASQRARAEEAEAKLRALVYAVEAELDHEPMSPDWDALRRALAAAKDHE